MSRRCPPEVRREVLRLAGAGSTAKELAEQFGFSRVTIYSWIRQEKIDRGEIDGHTTDQITDLRDAKRRIRQLETELAVARKVNETFLSQDLPPKGSSR